MLSELKNYIIAGIFVGVVLYLFGPNMFSNNVLVNQVQKSDQSQTTNVSYHNTVLKVNKSVVSIYTKRTVNKNIFFVDPTEQRLRRRDSIPTGQGSGVVVSTQGHILTNFHVIAGSSEILVRDSDGNDHSTQVIGFDPFTDLAVLKINKNLSPITFGEITDVRVGDVSLAIGNPLGVGQTITLGIVSATDKELSPEGYSYQRYVQTDAAINPGNSGGALVNTNGELIGINTSIVSKGGGSDGIGFAIPVDIAKYVLLQILEFGEVIRGFVGIVAEPNYRGGGVMVSALYNSGPAERSGIKPKDIIKKVNGIEVDKIKEMQNIIGKSQPGDLVEFEIQRNSDRYTVNVSVEKMPNR